MIQRWVSFDKTFDTWFLAMLCNVTASRIIFSCKERKERHLASNIKSPSCKRNALVACIQ